MTVAVATRRGSRTKAGVPAEVRAVLDDGSAETVNLMEWLAADMAAIALAVAAPMESPRRAALADAAGRLAGLGVLARIAVMGQAIGDAVPDPQDPWRVALAGHRSDIVRQWACYAVNLRSTELGLEERLSLTLPFAADRNMSVREAAWMAFRPHVAERLSDAVAALLPITLSPDANIRRFAIEVTRPRSVWGSHIKALKDRPETAEALLDNVRADPSRYVRLALANWLNDASKTRPDWVADLCRRWRPEADAKALAMLRRATRTMDAERKGLPSQQSHLFPS